MSWPRVLASHPLIDPPSAVAVLPTMEVVDLGSCSPQVRLYFRILHHVCLVLPPHNETWSLRWVPRRDIRQQHPTPVVAAAELSSWVGVEWDEWQTLLPLVGHHHPVIRELVARPAEVDAPVDTRDTSHGRLVSDLKADCHANT
jgi:hypothetical protein